MPQGYEVTNEKGERAWWDGKKLTPLDERGYAMKRPPAAGGAPDLRAFGRAKDTLASIDDAKSRTNIFRTGTFGGWTKEIPGSPAYNLDKDLDTLKARSAFEELQAMRAASPTGGALGGIAVEELKMLQAADASLDVGQGEDQLDKNLQRMRDAAVRRTQGVDPANPFTLTEANRPQIPEGAYFKAGDGQVYRNQKGAGYKPRAKAGSTTFSDPGKEARYQAWLKANGGR